MKTATIIDFNKAKAKANTTKINVTKNITSSNGPLSHDQVWEYLDHNIKLHPSSTSR